MFLKVKIQLHDAGETNWSDTKLNSEEGERKEAKKTSVTLESI